MRITWTEERHERREHFRRFGRDVVAPASAERDDAGAFDPACWKALAGEDFWPALTGPDRGAAVWDFLAGLEGLALGADDPGFLLSVVAHAGLVQVLCAHGSAEQRERVLPRLLTGTVGATAVTESTGGSHLSSIRTRAAVAGEGLWELTGTKTHITNAPVADLVLVVGRLDGIGDRDVTLFLLDRDRPGLRTGDPEDLLGQRTSPTGTVGMDRVPVTAEDLVGDPGRGMRTLHSFLALDRLMYGVTVAAHLESLLPRAVAHVTERRSFGVPLADHQFVQDKLVTIRTAVETARHLSYAAADALVRGDDTASALASCAKLAASEGGVQAALELVQLFGHAGYARGGMERTLRDVVGIRIAGGTTEMQKKNVANDVLTRYRP